MFQNLNSGLSEKSEVPHIPMRRLKVMIRKFFSRAVNSLREKEKSFSFSWEKLDPFFQKKILDNQCLPSPE